MQQILSIQYLRALAALSVVLFHEAENGGWSFDIGPAGVDLFFVISGFIMCLVTEEKETTPALFFTRRLIRIVPLYWAATFVTAALYLMHPHLLWGTDVHGEHLAASLFFIPHTTADGYEWPTLLQGWTLNIEMYFYLVIAGALFFPRKIQLPLISAILMISVAAGALFHPNSVVLKTYSSDLLLEFMAGLWIGQLYLQKKLPNQKLGLLLAVAGFLIFGVEGSAFHPLDSYRIFIWGLPAVLIVTGGLSLEAAGKVKSIPLLRHIGDASFSIYLLHNIVVPAVGLLPLPVAAKAALALASTCVVGFLAYRYFEIPVNRFLRSTQAKYSFNPR